MVCVRGGTGSNHVGCTPFGHSLRVTRKPGTTTSMPMPDLRAFDSRSAEHLRLVIETSKIGIWELDLATGHAVRNLTHDMIFGYTEPLPEWTYDTFLEHIDEADRARVDKLQKAAIENGTEWGFECRIKTADGRNRWISAAGRPLDKDGENAGKLIGHVIDITDTKRNEARLQLITEELNHRVRNILSMIKSMIKLSARHASDIPSFSRSLEGRVGALARSHSLLVGDEVAAMKPSVILETELSAFEELEDRVRINVSDEPQLSASGSQGLALVFHELITNAIKYGALSNDAGHVEVRIDRNEQSVTIVWTERNGPPVKPSKDKGFGSVLIERAIASHGSVELDFPSDGLVCRIELEVLQ